MPGTKKRVPAGEPRREELILAAYRGIAEDGFEGLRTRDIANAVGVNIATLHYYFPSKEDLIRSVIGHAMSRFQTTMAADGPAAARLRAHFQGLRRLSREEPELFAVMGELMLRSARDPELGAVIRKTDAFWHATLRGLIRDAQSAGDVPKSIDAEGMASVIVATLKGVYLLPVGTGPPPGFEKALRQLEDVLGIRASR